MALSTMHNSFCSYDGEKVVNHTIKNVTLTLRNCQKSILLLIDDF
jgi:hypothetical protein